MARLFMPGFVSTITIDNASLENVDFWVFTARKIPF
jgi:hypothetical protein